MPATAGFLAYPRAAPAVGFGTGPFGAMPFGQGAAVVAPPAGPRHGYVYATIQTRGPRVATLKSNGQANAKVTSGAVTATLQT